MEVFVFAIVAFVLGGIIILNRERVPDRLRRPLAIASLFMVAAAFVMVVAMFLRMGG